MYQKLLGCAAIILVLHNALLLVLGTLSTIEISRNLFSQDIVSLLIRIGTDGLDIVGILLLGVGLYGVSPAVPQGDRYAKISGGLFLLWILPTLIWRPFGRATYFSQRLGIIPLDVWAYVFFLASLILAAAVYNLHTVIGRLRRQRYILEGNFTRRIISDRHQKREVIMDQVDTLYLTYAGLNVLGVFLYIAFPVIYRLGRDPILALFMILLGGFIKGVVVPLLGILVFSHLRGVVCKMALPRESNRH